MKFLKWLGIMLVLFLINPILGVWAVILSGMTLGDGTSSGGGSCSSSSSDTKVSKTGSTSGHRGTGYNPGGDVQYYPGGNTSVEYGDVTYYSNRIHSVKYGTVTYYSDDNGKRLGRSVDQGNGVHVYFDDDGREIGHSYTSGRITDFIGDCFECR